MIISWLIQQNPRKGHVMASLFSKPKTPAPPKPTPMVDEDAVKRAKSKTAARVRGSSGRDSTILGEADRLGG